MDTPANKDELVQQFCALTQANPTEALSVLGSCDWNIEVAVQSWFAAQDDDNGNDNDDGDDGGAAAKPYDEDDVYDSEEEYFQRTLTKPIPVTSASDLKTPEPKRGVQSGCQKGGVRTLRDISSAPQDEDDDDKKDQDFFAGGEKSGLAVQGGPPSGAQDYIQGILNRARRNLPRPGGDDSPYSRAFASRGMTVGGDDAPSRIVPNQYPGASPNGPTPRPRARRTLHLWQDGFSVDDGDLYRYNDPANRDTLAMIQSGRAPIHILNVDSGQEVDLELDVRKEDKYVKPKPKYKPFSGQGQRLGNDVPDIEPSSSTTPASSSVSATAPASKSASSGDQTDTTVSTSSALPHVSVDESVPTVSLQVRLGDGSRLQSRFNTTHTIRDVYEFVNRSSILNTQRDYVLMTTFPSKDLEDKSAALGDFAEFKRGGVVVQKWKWNFQHREAP